MKQPRASFAPTAIAFAFCSLAASSRLFAAADLFITKTGPGGVKPGEQVVYTIEVGNAGPDRVPDALVEDAMPPGLTLVSVAGACSKLPCTLSLGVPDSRTITVTLRVPLDYAGPDLILNTAEVGSATVVDDSLGNNRASTTTALTRVRGFYTLPPCRVADTRGQQGVPIGGPALAAGDKRPFSIRDRCGLPDNAIGVSYNITVTAPTSAGDLRVFPDGEPSLTSAINYVSGQTRANNGIVKLPTSGAVVVQCDQGSGSVHFIMDVNGYFADDDKVTTPKGKLVRVRLAPEVELTFDEVTTGGSTSARVIEFPDDRLPPIGDKNLQDFFPAGSPERALLPNVVIPSFVRGLPKGGPNGPPTFVLAVIDTDAKFSRTAEFHGFEDFRLGWDPPCVDAVDPTREPRTFYAREAPKNEPPLVEETRPPYEGPVFVDTSSGCGSNKASGWNFSLYLTGRDTRKPIEIAQFMLESMQDVLLALGNFIDPKVSGDLTTEVDTALRTLSSNPQGSLDSVNAWIATVDQAPAGSIDNSARNVSGELVARGLAARHMIGKLIP